MAESSTAAGGSVANEADGEQQQEGGDEELDQEQEPDEEELDEATLQLVEAQTPELLKLTGDFRKSVSEISEKLKPLVKRVQEGRTSKGLTYLELKNQLLLAYWLLHQHGQFWRRCRQHCPCPCVFDQ